LILILGKKYKDYDTNIKEKFTLNNKVNFLYLIVLVAVFQIVIYSVYSLSENAIFKYGNLFPYSVLLVIIGNVRYLYIIKYKKLSSDQVKVFFEDKLLIFILLIYFLLITYMLYF
jgi:hypothetical protein